LKPLSDQENDALCEVVSFIPFIKLYTHRYLAAKKEEDFPIDMCEQLVGMILNLLDELQLGETTHRRHDSYADYCAEAVEMTEAEFSGMFGK
jgi:hypothetical protein